MQSVFNSIDTDRSGEIEIGEFKSWMSRNPKDGELLLKKGGEDKLRRTSDSTRAHLQASVRHAMMICKAAQRANGRQDNIH